MKHFFNVILLLFLSVNIASGADVFADRVGETTTTAGTGTISLLGAKTGFRTFVTGIGDGNTCKYLIINSAGQWEIGSGTVTDAATDTLSRDATPDSSSNAGAAVNFSAGTKDVYCIVTAEQFSNFSDFDGAYSSLSGTPTIPTISDTAYDATSWNDNSDAATKNAIRDKIETLGVGSGDVTGPDGAVSGNLPLLDATGKILSDSGTKPADFEPAFASGTSGQYLKYDKSFGTILYTDISGTPTIPSGNQIIDWTQDQGATDIHAGNYTDTDTTYTFGTGLTETDEHVVCTVTDTDDQGFDVSELDGTTLKLSLDDDGEATKEIELSSLQDGTGTDDQNIDVLSLDGTTLNISLEGDGEATKEIDLSGLQDGTGTDDQTATEVSFDNTDTGIVATDVQEAIDEIEARVDTNDGKVSFTWDYAYDDLTSPGANSSIDFGTYTNTWNDGKTTVHSFFTLKNDLADPGNPMYLLELQYKDADDNDAKFLKCTDAEGADTKFEILYDGSIVSDGNITGATYGSDGSISDAELLTIDDGGTTELLVGGGAGSAPVWTTATGTGAPMRAVGPVLNNGDTSAGYMDFLEDSDNGTNYMRLLGPPSCDTITVNLPATAGTLALTTDNITGTAALATEVTVTDNESTAENNLIPFVADAEAPGSNALETDGDLHYNPSTGTLTATEFVGGGAGLTGIGGGVTTGTTFPVSPSTGDLFLHAPTGRTILYQYDGSNWQPIISYGTMTLYVDATDGSDTLSTHGQAVDGDAFATIQFAIDCIPGQVGGNVVININGETYSEDLVVAGKSFTSDYTITLIGTLSQDATGTMDSAVTGTGSTKGSITDTGAFGSYDNQLIYANSEYRQIDSDTADTATITGTWSSAPSGTYYVYDWSTQITPTTTGLTIQTGQTGIVVQNIYFNGDIGIRCDGLADIEAQYCKFVSAENIGNHFYGNVTMTRCYFYYTGTGRMLNYTDGKSILTGCKLLSNGSSSNAIWSFRNYLIMTSGTIIDNFDESDGAIRISANGYVMCYSADPSGLNEIRNCTLGMGAAIGGKAEYTSYMTYTNCDTDESADAASFGYID